MPSDCLFCKIISGDIPSEQVYADDRVTAFRDINPVAPTHILIIPNKHIASVNDATPADEPALGRLLTTAKLLAAREGIAAGGYRLIMNTGDDGGQVVYHMHLHLIGGQKMKHPMG